MDDIDALARLFERFPGIGPRQARRFVYALLRSESTYRNELVERIQRLSKGITRCTLCGKFMAARGETLCTVCANPERSKKQLMIVLKDADIESFEATSVFNGTYVVLGTLAPLTEDILPAPLVDRLKRRIATQPVEEIVLALPVTTDGEHTTLLVQEALKTILPDTTSVTVLGRGLSTGSELEYADPQTLRNAFTMRKKGA